MRSEESLATVLLASPVASGRLRPLKASELWPLRDLVGELRTLLGRSERDLIEGLGLAPDLARRVVELLGRATAVAFEVERLEQSGIATLTPSDPAYPRHLRDRLGTRAPPVLHAAGAVGLLGDPGLGLVGCGATAPPELRVALEGLGLPLVHCEGHGPDGVCLVAEPLVRTLRRPEIRRAIYRGSTVVCTPYGPDTPFSSARATGLQPLIHGLSRVTLVVSCEPGTGDAWLGAIAALDGGYGKVAVWRGAGAGAGDHAGNERLEARGAVGVASTGDLEALLRSPGGSLPTGSP